MIPGTAYTITATGGGSGNPVQFNRGQTPTSICTVTTTGVLTFTGPGQCKITATQGGNTTYAPAPAAKQVIIVNRK